LVHFIMLRGKRKQKTAGNGEAATGSRNETDEENTAERERARGRWCDREEIEGKEQLVDGKDDEQRSADLHPLALRWRDERNCGRIAVGKTVSCLFYNSGYALLIGKMIGICRNTARSSRMIYVGVLDPGNCLEFAFEEHFAARASHSCNLEDGIAFWRWRHDEKGETTKEKQSVTFSTFVPVHTLRTIIRVEIASGGLAANDWGESNFNFHAIG